MGKISKKQAWCSDRDKMGRIGERPLWVLYFSIFIRAIHQVGAAVILSSFLIDGISRPPRLFLAIAIITGIVLVTTEGMRHRQMYREVSGLGTILKLLLLGAGFHGFLPVTEAVSASFILASLSSHTPKAIRHKLIF